MTLHAFLQKTHNMLRQEEVFYCRVKVVPGSPKNEILELMKGEESTLKVRIVAPPEKGKANKMLCKFLAKEFGCHCEIVSGKTHTVKLVKLKKPAEM